jgi:Zn-dependent protease
MKRLLVLLIAALTLLLLLILSENGLAVSPLFAWLALVSLFLVLNALMGIAGGSKEKSAEYEPEKNEFLEEQARSLATNLEPFLIVNGWKAVDGIFEFEGLLRTDPAEALKGINNLVDSSKVRAVLTEGEHGRAQLTLLPKDGQEQKTRRPKWPLHVTLLFLTMATTTWAGAMHQGINILLEPAKLAVGLPYSIGLLLILGAHELGHFFAARKHRIQVTPPFFIPAPFALGTFGAFIRMRGPVQDRRALFDVAMAGPLAGLVFAIPALLFGLQHSRVIIGNAPIDLSYNGVDVGSSFLMAILSKLALGTAVAQGHRIILQPLAFAGWLGLLVTALNLLPIGQLDGGHIAHALFGSRRAGTISIIALVSLFSLAFFVWPGLLIWAFIVLFLAGGRDNPAVNDLTPLDPSRRALGYFAFALLALILVPVPHSFYGTFGIHCPYV